MVLLTRSSSFIVSQDLPDNVSIALAILAFWVETKYSWDGDVPTYEGNSPK